MSDRCSHRSNRHLCARDAFCGPTDASGRCSCPSSRPSSHPSSHPSTSIHEPCHVVLYDCHLAFPGVRFRVSAWAHRRILTEAAQRHTSSHVLAEEGSILVIAAHVVDEKGSRYDLGLHRIAQVAHCGLAAAHVRMHRSLVELSSAHGKMRR